MGEGGIFSGKFLLRLGWIEMEPHDLMVLWYPKFAFREALCPIDLEENGVLIDDELNEILVQPLLAGVLGSSEIFIGFP